MNPGNHRSQREYFQLKVIPDNDQRKELENSQVNILVNINDDCHIGLEEELMHGNTSANQLSIEDATIVNLNARDLNDTICDGKLTEHTDYDKHMSLINQENSEFEIIELDEWGDDNGEKGWDMISNGSLSKKQQHELAYSDICWWFIVLLLFSLPIITLHLAAKLWHVKL